MSNGSTEAPRQATDVLENRNSLLARVDRICDARKLTLFAFLIGALVMFLYKPFLRPEVGDPTIYDYVAQSILRGQLPYRDVIDIKSPGSQYLSAVAIALGRVFDIRDIFSIRALHVLLVGLLSAITFVVTNTYFQSRLVSTIAFLVPLLREPIAKTFIGGTQPKLPMIIFGLIALLMIARDRPLAAGVFSMLSCLCWQPGLLFTGTAFLIFSRYLTTWRDLRALKVLAGAAIPLAVVLGYFYSQGALREMWAWTITYNYSVFGPEAGPTLGNAVKHIVLMTRRVFGKEILILLLSGLGLAWFFVERARERVAGKGALSAPDLFRDAIGFPPLIYGAFMLINFQGPPDLIPLLPFAGIFAGWFFVRLMRMSDQIFPSWKLSSGPARAGLSLAASVVLLAVIGRAATFKLDGLKLQDQDAAFNQLRQELQPGDKFYVHGAVEVLVLLNKPNINPYIDFDWGKDDFVTSRLGQSFSQIVDEMEAQAPRYVAITRLRKVYHRKELERWVDDRYRKLELLRYKNLYVRK